MIRIIISIVVGIEGIVECLRQIVTKWAVDISFTSFMYRKVASTNLSCLEAHAFLIVDE